jgi:hypothetical protein
MAFVNAPGSRVDATCAAKSLSIDVAGHEAQTRDLAFALLGTEDVLASSEPEVAAESQPAQWRHSTPDAPNRARTARLVELAGTRPGKRISFYGYGE